MTNSPPPTQHWLILSYCSTDGSACANHVDDRLPWFKKEGIEPVLLTGFCGRKRHDIDHFRVASFSAAGLRSEIRYFFKRHNLNKGVTKLLKDLLLLPLLPFYALEKICLDLDDQWAWCFLATAKGLQLARRKRVNMIYSTGGSVSAHLAASWISKRAGIPWIAEFQDPLVYGNWLQSRRSLRTCKAIERMICKGASGVIFLTDRARSQAAARTEMGERGHVIYPGADPAILPEARYRQRKHFHFAHFGSLGGSRNLVIFFAALKQLAEEHPELLERLRIDLYGSLDGLSRQAIDDFPNSSEFTKDHGRISRERALTAMQESDCLLLIQDTQDFSRETIPSKVYEYLLCGRPILGLIHQNPELAKILTERGHYFAAADDPNEISCCLRRILSSPDENIGQNPAPSPEPLLTSEATKKLIMLANR